MCSVRTGDLVNSAPEMPEAPASLWRKGRLTLLLCWHRLWWRHCRGAQQRPGLPSWAPGMPWTPSAMRSAASSADMAIGEPLRQSTALLEGEGTVEIALPQKLTPSSVYLCTAHVLLLALRRIV